MITDIHTHNRQANALTSVINLDLQEANELLQTSVQGHYSIGVHPWNTHLPIDWDLLCKLANDKRIYAIGECGLDKNATADALTQQKIFERQIQLAIQVKKPLIIHCVGRYNELADIKKAYPEADTLTWIIHGFRGKPQLAQQLIKAGFFLSFGKHFNQESFDLTPPERRFRETDDCTD